MYLATLKVASAEDKESSPTPDPEVKAVLDRPAPKGFLRAKRHATMASTQPQDRSDTWPHTT